MKFGRHTGAKSAWSFIWKGNWAMASQEGFHPATKCATQGQWEQWCWGGSRIRRFDGERAKKALQERKTAGQTVNMPLGILLFEGNINGNKYIFVFLPLLFCVTSQRHHLKPAQMKEYSPQVDAWGDLHDANSGNSGSREWDHPFLIVCLNKPLVSLHLQNNLGVYLL